MISDHLSVYLSHLSVERDGCDAQVSEQERHPLGVITGAAENHEGVPSQFIQDRNQITVLQTDKLKSHTFTDSTLLRVSV